MSGFRGRNKLGVSVQARSKFKSPAIIGSAVFVLGLILIVGAFSRTDSSQPTISVEPVEDLVTVLVPIRDIQVGEQLEPRLFRFEKRPKSSVPEGTVTSLEEIQGKFSKVALAQGLTISREHILDTKPTNLITATIPEGYRAVTIRVNETTSVEGWARPGANVDVLWMSNFGGREGLKTIVENAKVLSAERQVDSNSNQITVPSTVTLLVTAQDAAKIQLAASTGTLSLLLRGDTDSSTSTLTSPITVEDLLGRERKTEFANSKASGVVKIGEEEFYLIDGELVPK